MKTTLTIVAGLTPAAPAFAHHGAQEAGIPSAWLVVGLIALSLVLVWRASAR